MRIAKLEPFDSTQSYILATKSGSNLVLPALDGSNLFNLPVQSSVVVSKSTYDEMVSQSTPSDNSMFFVQDTKTLYLYSLPSNEYIPINVSEDMIVPDIEFTSANIVNGVLQINSTTPIANIVFFTNSVKSSGNIVQLPVFIENNVTKISFEDVNSSDYQYGGVVKFAKGITYYNGEDDIIYNVSNVSGNYIADANNGRTHKISGLIGNLNITSSNIINLPENKMMKIFVDNSDSNYSVSINGSIVSYEVFFCAFFNINGTIKQFKNVVELG